MKSDNRKFVASLDVEKLFPSMKTYECCEVVREVIRESKIIIKELDVRELSIFIRKNMSNNNIEAKGLADVTLKQKKRDEM